MRLTPEQFLALPESEPESELIDGIALPKTGGDRAHAVLHSYLGYLLHGAIKDGGEAGLSLTCVISSEAQTWVLIPDAVYLLPEHAPRTAEAKNDYHRMAPDFAVEIVAWEERSGWLAAKVQLYLRYGTRMVWVVDPGAQMIFVFTPDGDPRIFVPGDAVDGGDVLPGLQVSVTELFDQLTFPK